MKRKKIITHKRGRIKVSYTPKSRRLLMSQRPPETTGRPEGAVYSILRDLITPSRALRVKRIRKRGYVITPSGGVPAMWEDDRVLSSKTVSRKGSPRIQTVYWLKELKGPRGKDLVFVKDQREPQTIRTERGEAEDLQRQRRAGVRVPEFLLRIDLIGRSRTILVTRFLSNVRPADELCQHLSNNERRNLLRQIKSLGLKLIDEGILPLSTQGDHFLVSHTKPRQIYLTDTAIGFKPISISRLVLLRALAANPSLPRPNWDAIRKTYKGMERYWGSLLPVQRKYIQRVQLNLLLDEIRRGPSARPSYLSRRPEIEELVLRVFPNSKHARKIKRSQ